MRFIEFLFQSSGTALGFVAILFLVLFIITTLGIQVIEAFRDTIISIIFAIKANNNQVNEIVKKKLIYLKDD